jgi:hypothetical protein
MVFRYSTGMRYFVMTNRKLARFRCSRAATIRNSCSQTPGTSTLDWKSTGAKVGLDFQVELNKELAFGVGGSYGMAKRDATLSGIDGAAVNTGTAPRVGNAEAKITCKPVPDKPLTNFSLNTFAGVNNYDTKAPGIATAPAGTAPAVKFPPASDFYAGAGAMYKFVTE